MRIAVVTPYHQESLETLTRCLDSVRHQTVAATHIVIADGAALGALDHLGVQHIRLPAPHGDYGDTPRLIGSISAISQAFDAIAWLDADNWFEPNHFEAMLAVLGDAAVVTAARRLRRPDGSELGLCTESDGVTFSDTNCYLITRAAFPVVTCWGFKDKRHAVVGDRVIWHAIKNSNISTARSPIPTVNYTTRVASHYLQRGETPPDDARTIVKLPGDTFFRSMLYRDFMASQGTR